MDTPDANDSPIRTPTPSKSAVISPIDPNASLIAVVIVPDKSPRLDLRDPAILSDKLVDAFSDSVDSKLDIASSIAGPIASNP